MKISIPDEVLIGAKMSPNELLIDFATYMYEKKLLSIGQASSVAALDLISFQKELSKRNIYIHYEVSDLEKDLKNLNVLNDSH